MEILKYVKVQSQSIVSGTRGYGGLFLLKEEKWAGFLIPVAFWTNGKRMPFLFMTVILVLCTGSLLVMGSRGFYFVQGGNYACRYCHGQ